MPISPDATAGSDKEVPTLALDWLRGRANPFDSLVRPQRPDEHFLDQHEPTVHQAEYQKLAAVVDAYRVEGYRLKPHRTASDLPDSRVVTVLGARGDGKTHLLEALAHRPDRQLLIRPTYYEPQTPFEEALLQHFVSALRARDAHHGRTPFQEVAASLARRFLRQALSSQPITANPEGPVVAAEQLLADLGRADLDLPGIISRQELAPPALVELIERRLRHWEHGGDGLPSLRSQLFLALVRATLLHDADALDTFLETAFTPAGALPVRRGEVVRQLLNALVEMCALVRLPVVFAFDNLEGLVAPQGELDATRLRAFLDGLAQAVDATRGLLFLLFAESELYRTLRTQGNPFALSRLDQGVSIPGQGLVDVVAIDPVAPDALRNLIERRVGHALHGFPQVEQLPRLFPFLAASLVKFEQMTGGALRLRLQAIREEYTRLVRQQAPTPSADLEQLWQQQLGVAGQQLQDQSLVDLAPGLHAGLRQLLQWAGIVEQGGWRLAGVEPGRTTANAPHYAQVSVLEWQPVAGANNGSSARPLRVVLGFLLGQRRAMPRDLESKFAPLADAAPADGLVVWWTAPAGAALPGATGELWDGSLRPAHAALRNVEDEAWKKLLAVNGWLRAVGEQGLPVADEAVRGFLARQGESLLPLAKPPESLRNVDQAH